MVLQNDKYMLSSFMVVIVQVVIFYVVRKCNLVSGHQHFKGAHCLHLLG
jgi:hypothetical protein